jgi:branched-chain amino acid transport system permease protein
MTVVSIAIMLGIGFVLARSRWGVALRAVAQDIDAARLMGVPVRKMFPVVMGFASALAGVAGVFLGAEFFASPTAGDQPLLIALIVVIFGGLGSLPGTVYAAYLIGLIQAASSTLISTTWSLPILYGVILVVLVIRPQGLLGRPMEARL